MTAISGIAVQPMTTGQNAALSPVEPLDGIDVSKIQPGLGTSPQSSVAQPSAVEIASRGSFRDAFSLSRPSAADQLGGKVLDRLDKLQRSRLPDEGDPGTNGVGVVDPRHGNEATNAPDGAAAFDRQMDMLQKSFDRAIEVELASKTSTSLASSMNKLMSGN